MRKVAGYSFSAKASTDGHARIENLNRIVEAWIQSKGTISGSSQIRYNDGRIAEYSSSATSSPSGSLREHGLLEPTESGLFQTQISLGLSNDQLAVYAELRAAGDTQHLGPMELDVRCPQVVRQLLDCREDWYVGDTPVRAQAIPFSGGVDGQTFINVVWHPSRNLPVVAISRHGEPLTENFSDNIAGDLAGLALVAEIDDAAAWHVTNTMGREWSCYNGAIRIYWPITAKLRDPYAHPLWTRGSLLGGVTEPRDASYRIRRQLRRRIIGLSAFSVAEPVVFGKIRSEARLQEFEALKKSAAGTDDWRNIAEDYAKDNDGLRQSLEEAKLAIRDLEAQVSNLTLAIQWKEEPANDQEPQPERQTPPATVAEAVRKAQDNLHEVLRFGEDVATGVRSLAADAGPPEKIYKYLQQLALATKERNAGPLGTTMVQWLRNRGVNASGESETIKHSASESRKRTWHDGERARVFDLHLKPSEAVSPDRCVRIYFDYDEHEKCTCIGWVGRHP
ncbi:MAG TPA: hypothetical protein VFB08_15190 [Burkholderiales bacterium]|nr:hypothetical protein [Burkholderiales bacterium]